MPAFSSLRTAAGTVVAGVFAALIILALVLSASPILHNQLHHNETQGQHFCLACALASGQVSETETLPLQLFFAFACLWSLAARREFVISVLDLRLLPARAPPCR